MCASLEDSNDASCILLLYEKSPNLCYSCGRLGHPLWDCEDNTMDKPSLVFRCWMWERVAVAPIGRRIGNLRNRNSGSNVPFVSKEEFESPINSNP